MAATEGAAMNFVLTYLAVFAHGPSRTAREGCGVGGLFYRQDAKSAKDAKEIQKPLVSSLRPWRPLRLGGKKKVAQSAYAMTRRFFTSPTAAEFHAPRVARSALEQPR
jgi:hypothetical protein